MFAGVIRLTMVLLISSVVALTAARLVGAVLPDKLAVGYHENEGEVYIRYVEDLPRHIRLWLAGTRCYSPLPPWAYSNDPEVEARAPYLGHSYARFMPWEDGVEDLLACG